MKHIAIWVLWMFRLFSLLALGLLLAFPAYKGVWLGWVPVALGLGLAWWWMSGLGDTVETRCARRLTDRQFLAWVVGLSCAAQVVLVLALRPEAWSDGKFVVAEARVLVDTGHLSPLTYYPPLQTWWYALFFKLLGSTDLVAQLSHVPAWALCLVAAYAVAVRVGPPAAARAATLVLAAYPSLVLYVLTTPYYLYLYTAFGLLLTAAWLDSVAGRRCGPWGVGVWGAFSALTKAVNLIAPVQALAASLLVSERWWPRRTWKLWLLSALVFAGVLAPWVLRNTRVFGQPVLICTSGGLVLYSANNPESNGLYSSVPDEVHIESAPEFLAYARACSGRAWTFIREQPGRFLRLVALKNLHTWGNEATFAELVNVRGRAVASLDLFVSFLAQLGWAFVAGLWAFCSAARLRARAAAAPIEVWTAVVVLSNVLVYSLYEGGARHHLPLVPLLLCAVLRPTRSSAATPAP